MRETLSARLAEALASRNDRDVALKLLQRTDVALSADRLIDLAATIGVNDARFRGALLARADLPAAARLLLVEATAEALRGTRLVRGAVQAKRLDALFRNSLDTALTTIGEGTPAGPRTHYAAALVEADRISSRVMLHAIIHGHVMFFADCLAQLAELPRDKVFTLLETGSRAALNALLARCGMNAAIRNLIARLVFHARTADLADDAAARHFVVTVLTEELIVEHDGVIPAELEDAFAYLSEQNIALARGAARGVMSSFAGAEFQRPMPVDEAALPAPLIAPEPRIALPAA
jgi:uncharacterized protein (DUF2336 family)